ncbi:XAC2610-related protein [Acinetobacter sp. Marseille-Q1623]|uniref:XAC2610-related protein n=1 Tax=Acinetobacter sp. Marseille-Q1623 TaxID=2697501 RepID=UPI00157A3810|nr:hypothetical protein [Acinetobacter sp. Marseille-Q1623]
MKFKILLGMVAITFSNLNHAGTVINSKEFKPLNEVRVSMQRMLRSTEGRYFLSLYAGIWNPHAVLTDLVENKNIAFKGLQKADQLTLKSVNSETDAIENGAYQLTGTLNANTGYFKTLLSAGGDTFGKNIQFEPAVKVSNKPSFVFKFYSGDQTTTYGAPLQRVDVVNKSNNQTIQSLTGFVAYPKSIGYMDINFDGYYDVILSDISQSYSVEDKRYIYWMYNPKTGQFQRSPQLDKIIGFPNLHGEKQQIDFGGGRVYQVKNGLLNRI